MIPSAAQKATCAAMMVAALSGCAGAATPRALPWQVPPAAAPARSPIKHIIILLQENRTFDNLFHGYPGANFARFGYNHKGQKVKLPELPLITSWDLGHDYADWLMEYNGGKMNGFDLDQVDPGHHPKYFAYGYARRRDVKIYWDLAAEGVLGDAMFADHRSQTYAGHFYPVAGASGPVDPVDPNWYVADNPVGSANCVLLGYGKAIDIMTGDTNKFYRTCFNIPTIGDELTAQGVSWRYYVAFYDREGIMNPYASIPHVVNGPQWANVVSPETTIFTDIWGGTLPSVSWVIASYANSDHPGQDVPSSNGPNWIGNVLNTLGASRYWRDSAVILTYDDWGGWYDHVKPKTFDYYEPGFRIPLVIVSPYARRGLISHRVHYTGSILHFIEQTFGLPSLGKSDARSDAFDDCFDFKQQPLPYIPVHVPSSSVSRFESQLPSLGEPPQDPARRD